MAARAIRDDDADNSLLIKHCSPAINCCSVDVRFCATRWPQCGPLSGGRREGVPAVNSLDSMLMGIDAGFSGVLSSFMIDVADVEEVDEPVAVDATVSAACGDARLCRACGIPEMTCGPVDMIVSRSVPPEVPAMKSSTATRVRDLSPQTKRSPALASGGHLRDPATDAGPWRQPGRTPRCPRPSASHDRGAAVHPSSCRG